jgi:hypothetical protein
MEDRYAEDRLAEDRPEDRYAEDRLDSAEERARELRGNWDGSGADTEMLRNALRHYRVFIERLSLV